MAADANELISEDTFDALTYEQRKIKQKGRPKPEVLIKMSGSKKVLYSCLGRVKLIVCVYR